MNERLFSVSKPQILRRICGEYLEMPGLQLTARQAQRLWGLDEATCAPLLTFLVETKFLTCTVDGKYVRLSEGALRWPPLRMAKTSVDSKVSLRAREKPPAA